MKQTLFLLLLGVCCTSSCKNKDTNVRPDTTLNNTEQTDAIIENAEGITSVFNYFKKILNEEGEKFSVSFKEDTLNSEKHSGFLLNDTSLSSSRKIVLTNSHSPSNYIVVNAHILKNEEAAVKIIDNLCEEYRKEVQSGEVSKITFRAFRKDTVIYEIVNIDNSIDHIIASAFVKLIEKYEIGTIDIFPCDRKYMAADLAKQIKPVINTWLNYYKLNISDFIYTGRSVLNLDDLRKDKTYPYYGEFQDEDDVYNPVLNDYSPDKTKYVNLMASLYVNMGEDGKYHFTGSDDSHQLGLFDRKNKSFIMVSFRGSRNFADAVFWMDNNTFIVTGYDSYSEVGYYSIEIYDLKKDSCQYFQLRKKYDYTKDSYGVVNMKSRGIIIDE